MITRDHHSTIVLSDQVEPFPDPIPNIIPFGTITLFGGAPGVGKTAMLAEWCARWRDGRTIFGMPTNPPPGGLFYLASDRGWASAQQWFRLVGYPDIPHYALASDLTWDLDTLTKDYKAYILFQRCLDKLNPPPGAHLIIDPLSPLFIMGSPNHQRDVAKTLLIYSRECQQRAMNLTATVHFGKQKGEVGDRYARPQDRIAGSTSFAGFSDTQVYLVDPEPPDHPHYRLGWVPRHAPMEEFEVRRDHNGLFVPVSLDDLLETAVEKVYKLLPGPTQEPISLGQLILATGIPKRTLTRALDELRKDGRAVRVSKGYYRRTQTQ